MRAAAFLIPVLAVSTCVAAAAPENKQHVQAESLASVSAIKPGEPFKVGVRFKIDPEWHIYWINPGESGEPTTVQWTFPEGYKVGAVEYPVPVNFPQPGTMGSYAKQDKLIDLNKVIKPEWLKENYNQGFIDTNTVSDASGNKILGGIFNRINFKSAVWYPKKAFDEAGYTVPTTWDELTALQDQIVKDGDPAWCTPPGWLDLEKGSRSDGDTISHAVPAGQTSP